MLWNVFFGLFTKIGPRMKSEIIALNWSAHAAGKASTRVECLGEERS